METFSPSGFSSDFSGLSKEESVEAGFTDNNICGTGASCVVYRLRLNGLRVAIKRLRPEHLTNPSFVAAYRKEFQIGQLLKHDSLPLYRGLREDTDEVYIVMDYIDGISLNDFLDTDSGLKYFSNRENIRRFLSELLNAVGYLHRSGVIHCDLKPANVMLRHSDQGVMLLDLDKSYCDTMDLTHGGTTVISPPMTNGQKPTVQKDFIAIGNILEEIARCVPGFPKRSFSRFIKECRVSDATIESLNKALKSRVSLSGLIIGTVLLLGLGGGIWFLFQSKDTPKTVVYTTHEPVKSNVDTIQPVQSPTSPQSVPTIQTPQVIYEPTTPQPPKHTPITQAEFDAAMHDFVVEAEAAQSFLRSGKGSDKQLYNLANELANSYLARYNSIRETQKKANPDISGVDIDLEIARVSEKNKAAILWQETLQAIYDTIHGRQTKNIIF